MRMDIINGTETYMASKASTTETRSEGERRYEEQVEREIAAFIAGKIEELEDWQKRHAPAPTDRVPSLLDALREHRQLVERARSS